MFQCILVIVLSALLDVWAYVGHVALVPLSSNPQARWRGWPEGQLDPAPPKGSAVLDHIQLLTYSIVHIYHIYNFYWLLGSVPP